MTLYKEWHDFVRHKINTIYTEEQRLDVSKAIRFKTEYAAEYLTIKDGDIEKYGVVTQQADVVGPDDSFEAMEITSFGQVTIWTRNIVWGLVPFGPIEKLRYFVRNPPNIEAKD